MSMQRYKGYLEQTYTISLYMLCCASYSASFFNLQALVSIKRAFINREFDKLQPKMYFRVVSVSLVTCNSRVIIGYFIKLCCNSSRIVPPRIIPPLRQFLLTSHPGRFSPRTSTIFSWDKWSDCLRSRLYDTLLVQSSP